MHLQCHVFSHWVHSDKVTEPPALQDWQRRAPGLSRLRSHWPRSSPKRPPPPFLTQCLCHHITKGFYKYVSGAEKKAQQLKLDAFTNERSADDDHVLLLRLPLDRSGLVHRPAEKHDNLVYINFKKMAKANNFDLRMINCSRVCITLRTLRSVAPESSNPLEVLPWHLIGNQLDGKNCSEKKYDPPEHIEYIKGLFREKDDPHSLKKMLKKPTHPQLARHRAGCNEEAREGEAASVGENHLATHLEKLG